MILNDLNRNGTRELDSVLDEFTADVDVNGDGGVSALDALQVINYIASLNSIASSEAELAPMNLDDDDDDDDALWSRSVDEVFALL